MFLPVLRAADGRPFVFPGSDGRRRLFFYPPLLFGCCCERVFRLLSGFVSFGVEFSVKTIQRRTDAERIKNENGGGTVLKDNSKSFQEGSCFSH